MSLERTLLSTIMLHLRENLTGNFLRGDVDSYVEARSDGWCKNRRKWPENVDQRVTEEKKKVEKITAAPRRSLLGRRFS